MIKSVLIANRGEIAIRIAKTAKKMGIRSYMLLTHQEPNALYLNYADEVIDTSGDTFINIFMSADRLVALACEHNIEAIHPGYGFLSENPYLPKECQRQGIVFVGPSHTHIERMGNKGVARATAKECGIPIPEGSRGIIATLEEARESAATIGYPIIIKAVAGGGGKGMRVVENEDVLEKMLRAAINEAKSVFGNGAVFIEKFILKPRHIEVQVIGDTFGNVVHLYDRECSIQRKHQKLMEEAPSPALTDAMRTTLCNYALQLCRQTGYFSAGTIEFLLDAKNDAYFMEMNTRIQVEHPVTEMITGVDIVEQQFIVASGKPLTVAQSDITITGNAIEFRINAEDVQAEFSSCTGIIEKIDVPTRQDFRFDSGYATGKVIPACFDSMLAKAIIHGDNRADMIKKAKSILDQIKIRGVKTTLPFFKKVLTVQAFIDGNYYTDFIETEMDQMHHQQVDEQIAAACIALSTYLKDISALEEAAPSQNNWHLKLSLKSN